MENRLAAEGARLKAVLIANGVSESEFLIGGFREDAVCIREEADGYHIFTAYRGDEDDLVTATEWMDAVNAFINKLRHDKELAKKIYDEFVNKI